MYSEESCYIWLEIPGSFLKDKLICLSYDEQLFRLVFKYCLNLMRILQSIKTRVRPKGDAGTCYP